MGTGFFFLGVFFPLSNGIDELRRSTQILCENEDQNIYWPQCPWFSQQILEYAYGLAGFPICVSVSKFMNLEFLTPPNS
jgi:hypothetical protein